MGLRVIICVKELSFVSQLLIVDVGCCWRQLDSLLCAFFVRVFYCVHLEVHCWFVAE